MLFSILRMLVTVTLGSLLLVASAVAQQNPREIFERARMLDESNQNLSEAIKLYSQVISQADQQRALASRAQYRIGVLYDRMGRKVEAQRAFQTVVRQYSDQPEATRARAKLPASAVKNDKERPKSLAAGGPMSRQLWSGNDVDSTGSPDASGNYLSFTDWSTGDLAVRDLIKQQNRRLTNKGTWASSDEYAEVSKMSPDGRRVAYTWFNDKFYDLRIMGVDGSNARTLYSNPEMRYVDPSAWFPDGKHLVMTILRPGLINQMVIISTADGSLRTLKTLDWRFPQHLSVSPDNRWIAYDFPPLESSSKHDIYLLASDGSGETKLVEHPGHDYLLGWLPDGDEIVFASDRTGTISIWTQRVVGGKPEGTPKVIKPDVGQIYPLGLTPDGSLYYSIGGMRDVLIAEVDAKTSKLKTPRNATDRYIGANGMPDWSPDGKYLAYISRRSLAQRGIGSRVIVIRSDETGEERELRPKLDLPRAHRGGPRWSPDGRFLAVVGRDDKGRIGVYGIDVQTAEVIPLVQSQPGLSVPDWTSDGKLVFVRNGFGDDQNNYLVMRDSKTGQEKILHQSRHIHWIAVSRDKRQVAFSTELQPTAAKVAMSNVLLLLPLNGGEAKELLRVPETQEFTAFAWTPDGQHLLFLTGSGAGDNSAAPQRISVAGGKPEATRLVLIPKWSERQLSGMRFHPDGRRVAFTDYSNLSAEVLVLENFLPKTKRARAR